MLRAMVFIDHMNFTGSLFTLYSSLNLPEPKLDYKNLPACLLSNIYQDSAVLLKTFLFIPEPDDFLMNDSYWSSYYKWASGMENYTNFDVIKGRYVARQVASSIPMDISNKTTYYKVEKGTDINLAVNVITKAYNNAFDIAIIISGDSDFAMVFNQLKMIGKIGVVAAVKGQNIVKIKKCADNCFIMDKPFFDSCLR